ncbi:hypothetical protein P9224_06270, partial [Heyndrickxia coagulans]|nr:hypothetical protein [Heyndrickxia coagulans]
MPLSGNFVTDSGLCLDNQLIEQVLDDGISLGINCVRFDDSIVVGFVFFYNEAILVTRLQKLFN